MSDNKTVTFAAMVSTTADGFLVKPMPALRLAIFPPRKYLVTLEPVETQLKSELRPCPFCGGETVRRLGSYGKYSKMFYVKCWGCGQRTDYYDSDAEAVAAWNRRDA